MPASRRSDFIHIASESSIHIAGIRNRHKIKTERRTQSPPVTLVFRLISGLENAVEAVSHRRENGRMVSTVHYQFSEGLSARSMTRISTVVSVDCNLSPRRSCSAVKIDGRSAFAMLGSSLLRLMGSGA